MPRGVTPEPTSYTIDAWFQQLRHIGGLGIVGDACRAQEHTMKVGGVPRIVYGCGCGQVAKGRVPYEQPTGRRGSVTVCAVCDAATQMPRFA